MKHRIVTAAQMKEIERAGNAHGLPYLQMMENAGLATCTLMNRQRESGAFVLAVDLPSGINTKKHFPLYLHCK